MQLHYTEHGAGTETIVFSHGYLFSGEMFADQVEHLKSEYRCITYDHRGQGKSAVTKNGYDIETLTEDASQFIEKLDIGPCHFVGLSMGGFVGLRLAFRRPEQLSSLVLIDTSADPEPSENLPRYLLLKFLSRWLGLGVVVRRVMLIMFGRTFLENTYRAQERDKWRRSIASNNRIGTTRAIEG